MSGSGGGPGLGGQSSTFDDCTSLVIDTQLSSPKENVIDRLHEGDMLDVVCQEIEGRVVVVLLYEGELAGGVAAPQVQRLRECLEDGTRYIAEVKSINEGQVRVRIIAMD